MIMRTMEGWMGPGRWIGWMGALLLIGCGEPTLREDGRLGQGEQAEVSGNGFVKARGTRFELDGQPFNFQGTNYHHIGLLTGRAEREVYEAMRVMAERGLKVVRLWAFSCQGGHYAPEQPMIAGIRRNGSGGFDIQYNPAALERLDVALDAARQASLKLILTLTNFEPEYCGMRWWTQAITGEQPDSPDDRQNTKKIEFYTNRDIVETYQKHIAFLLSRQNTRTRVRYRDDPTIMAVELANEPHTIDWADPSGRIVHDWLVEMSAFVKGIDPNHLVASGEEGYMVSEDGLPDFCRSIDKYRWIDRGLKGVDFASNVGINSLDFATVHFYPDNWNIHSADFAWARECLVKGRAAIAHRANKPIVLEESGFSLANINQTDYCKSPADPGCREYLKALYQTANEAGYAGTMVWQALPPGAMGNAVDSQYDFTFDSARFQEIQDQIAHMNTLNQGQTPPQPSAYFPRCQPEGVRGKGFALRFTPGADPSYGWMAREHGPGFSCIKPPLPQGQDTFPACALACPFDPQTAPSAAWGWCQTPTGFSCRK